MKNASPPSAPRPASDDGHHSGIGLAEAADRLGVHYMTAYRYVRTGRLRADQQGGHWVVTEDAVAAFRDERETAVARPGRSRARAEEQSAPITARQVVAFADRLVGGDEAGAWRVIEDALTSGAELADVHGSLLTPALRRIGDQWEAGEVSVAGEHRATVVASRLVARLGSRFARPGRTRGTVVLAGAPGDRHALPTAIVADLLRNAGLNVVDLGADTPAEEIARAAAGEDRLLAVGVCATLELGPAGERRVRDAVRLVRETVGCPVLVGGSGVTTEAMASRIGADHRTASLSEAAAWFVQLAPRVRRPVEEGTR